MFKNKRNVGIILLILSFCALLGAHYIKGEVAEGNARISSAENQVQKGKRLFSINPATRVLGDVATGSAERKIIQGKKDILYYTRLANWLQIGGIFTGLGGLVWIYTHWKQTRNR